MTEDGVDDVGVECEESKDVGATRGKVGGFDLGDTTNLAIIAGALVVVDVLLFFVSTAAFHREEILTKWK